MANSITVDNGIQTYDIQNEDGTIFATISFNPSDVGIATRGEKAMKEIGKAISDFQTKEESDSIFDQIEMMRKCEKIIMDALDYMLGSSVSDKLFAHVSPLTITQSGALFIENVCNALVPEIETSIDRNITARRDYAAKHTSGGKYQNVNELLADLDKHNA